MFEIGIELCFSKIEVIKDWFIFCIVKELRSFFGIILYYCCFIKGFVDIVKVFI